MINLPYEEEENNMTSLTLEEKELFHSLYQKTYDLLLVFVLKNGISPWAADDIVQEIYYEAIKKAAQFCSHPNQGGWMMETARKKMSAYRKRMAYRKSVELEDWQTEDVVMYDSFGMVELSMVMESTLTAHERTLFRMYYQLGYTAREMAEMEHMTEGSFKVKMHRLRQKLVAALKK